MVCGVTVLSLDVPSMSLFFLVGDDEAHVGLPPFRSAGHRWLGDPTAEPKARLTRRPVPLAVRQLRDFNPGSTAPP